MCPLHTLTSTALCVPDMANLVSHPVVPTSDRSGAATVRPFGVSVVMATYNGERFLQAQLDSLAMQTRLPDELVVQDDGSSDETWAILEAFRDCAPFPVRLYRNERNTGYGETFLQAALRATGEWLAFCDQDDVWLPEKLEVTARAAQRTPEAVLVSHSADLVDESLSQSGGRKPDYKRQWVSGPLGAWPIRVVPGFTLVFDRTLLANVPLASRPRDLNGPEHRLAHDQLIPFLANVFGRTVHLPDTLALYRRHGGAVTGEAGSGAYRTDPLAAARLHLRASAEDYTWSAEIADEHAEYLEVISGGLSQTWAQRARTGAAYYHEFAKELARRAALYDRRRRRSYRALVWTRLLVKGRYRRIGLGVGFGWRACAKDLALGVLR